MGEGAMVICDDCGLSEFVLLGALMSGIERTVCACRTCRRFVTLEHDWALDAPRPKLVCPHCSGSVEAIEFDFSGDRVVAHRVDDWREGALPPAAGEQASVGCPVCGGELRTEGSLLAD